MLPGTAAWLSSVVCLRRSATTSVRPRRSVEAEPPPRVGTGTTSERLRQTTDAQCHFPVNPGWDRHAKSCTSSRWRDVCLCRTHPASRPLRIASKDKAELRRSMAIKCDQNPCLPSNAHATSFLSHDSRRSRMGGALHVDKLTNTLRITVMSSYPERSWYYKFFRRVGILCLAGETRPVALVSFSAPDPRFV
jgi:hypothetical protein